MVSLKSSITHFALGLTLTLSIFAYSSNQTAQAETNIYVVLDGSGSMWGQVEGKAKIETALDTLHKAVETFPESSNAGLVAYGHREEKNCEDVETLIPLSPLSKEEFVKGTANFSPKGKTPIAHALGYTAGQFTNNDAVNSIVLISDGIETCSGDPCAVVKDLREEQGLNIDVHVIGFDLNDDDHKQLQCIADAGNGLFINANNTQALEDAFEEVVKNVKVKIEEYEAKPKPEEKEEITTGVYFEGRFDSELNEQDWVIAEENPMFHTVDKGKLNLAGDKELQNVIMANRPLPEGDWKASLNIESDISTGKEIFSIGIYEDKDNFLMGQLTLHQHVYGDDQFIKIAMVGKLGGKATNTDETVLIDLDLCQDEAVRKRYTDKYECRRSNIPYKEFFKNNIGKLQFIKKGATVKMRATFEYEYDKGWIETPELPLFKPFGKIGVNFSSGTDQTSTAKFDDFVIENLEE